MKGAACGHFYFTSVGEMRAEERCVQYHRAIQELMEVESSRQDDASSLACESWLNKVVVQLCATCVNATALPPISPKPWLATMVTPRQGELAVLDSYLQLLKYLPLSGIELSKKPLFMISFCRSSHYCFFLVETCGMKLTSGNCRRAHSRRQSYGRGEPCQRR